MMDICPVERHRGPREGERTNTQYSDSGRDTSHFQSVAGRIPATLLDREAAISHEGLNLSVASAEGSVGIRRVE